MHLDLLHGDYAVAKLPPDSAIPGWAAGGEFVSITRTRDELSIVATVIPASVDSRRGWRCLKVRGPLDFSLTGILASLATPLADAGVPIFAISTFDTDYVLVFESDLDRAIAALEAAGHRVA
jgi:hypothetical protein